MRWRKRATSAPNAADNSTTQKGVSNVPVASSTSVDEILKKISSLRKYEGKLPNVDLGEVYVRVRTDGSLCLSALYELAQPQVIVVGRETALKVSKLIEQWYGEPNEPPSEL